jgi:hypothetical protein
MEIRGTAAIGSALIRAARKSGRYVRAIATTQMRSTDGEPVRELDSQRRARM